MTKSIGLTFLCAGMLCAAASFAPSAAAAATATTPQWKTRAEYEAFAAFYNEKDPSKQIPLIEAFLKKYPESEFKDRAYLVEMASYRKLGDSAKAIVAARNALKFDPQYSDVIVDDPALSYLAFTLPYTYNSNAPDAQSQLSEAVAGAQKGLALLPEYQKAVKPQAAQLAWMREAFNTAAGFAELQERNYAAAVTALKAAEKDGPSSSLLFSMLGQAYYYSTPPDYNNALWYLARSVSLAQASKSPNAAALQQFFDQAYTERHCTADGATQLIQQAGATPDPPAGFQVSRPQKPAATGNQNVDAFYQNIYDPLVVDCAEAAQNWKQLNGQPLSMPGRVVSVAPSADGTSTVISVAITPQTQATQGAFDVQLNDSSQADAKLLQPNDPVTFNGTLSAYATKPNFYVTLSNATVNQETIKMAEERQKAAEQAKKLHHPVRHRG